MIDISIKDIFTQKAQIIHGDKYNYSISNIIDMKTNIYIYCNTCQKSFPQTPNNHLQGRGCRGCAIRQTKQALTKSKEQFIIDAQVVHGVAHYDYSRPETIYINAYTDMEIWCNIHNKFFSQDPHHHLLGCGCFDCGCLEISRKKSHTKEQFIENAQKIHGTEHYDYSKSETIYKNGYTNIEIWCNVHKEFFPQRPGNHLMGNGCKRCSKAIVSKLEILWLDYLNVPNDRQHRQIWITTKNDKYKVDGFDPITNIIYEFNGDFWHGNPKRFKSEDINPRCNKSYGDMYKRTLYKELDLKNAGYKVISIWESDWKQFQKELKNNTKHEDSKLQ